MSEWPFDLLNFILHLRNWCANSLQKAISSCFPEGVVVPNKKCLEFLWLCESDGSWSWSLSGSTVEHRESDLCWWPCRLCLYFNPHCHPLFISDFCQWLMSQISFIILIHDCERRGKIECNELNFKINFWKHFSALNCCLLHCQFSVINQSWTTFLGAREHVHRSAENESLDKSRNFVLWFRTVCDGQKEQI